MIYTHAEPIVDPLLPRGQAGFRQGSSTVDQVTLLTQAVEDSYLAKKKAGAVFINLAAIYDTVWHHNLTCVFCWIGTWFCRSCNFYKIAVLPLLLVLDCRTGYDASRRTSHKNQY